MEFIKSKYESSNGNIDRLCTIYNETMFYLKGLESREIMIASNRTLQGEIDYCNNTLHTLEESISGQGKHFHQYRPNGKYFVRDMAIGTVHAQTTPYKKTWLDSENALHKYSFEYDVNDWKKILIFADRIGASEQVNRIIKDMEKYGFMLVDGFITNGTDKAECILTNDHPKTATGKALDSITIDNTTEERKPFTIMEHDEATTISDVMKSAICKVYRDCLNSNWNGTATYIERIVDAMGYQFLLKPWKDKGIYLLVRDGKEIKDESVHISKKNLEQLGLIYDECDTFTNQATMRIINQVYRVLGLI